MKFTSMKKKTITTGNIIIIIFINFIFLLPTSALAQKMTSPNYELIKPNLNFGGAYVSGSDKKLGFTGGQLGPGPYESSGFQLWAGFWYIKKIIPFTFTVSNNVIEFGSLTTNTPKIEKTTITVSTGSAGGYQVTAQENHSMMSYGSGAKIKDVTGDNNDISETTAGDWLLDTTDGLGYSLSGDDVPTPFPTRNPAVTPVLTKYKQFSDLSNLTKSPQVIMSSSSVGENRTLDVFYKINISAFQEAGRYQNVITYIATPTY